MNKVNFLSPKHTTSVVLSTPQLRGMPSGITDIPSIGKHKSCRYVLKRVHASPKQNLPNCDALRQEKFQKFVG